MDPRFPYLHHTRYVNRPSPPPPQLFANGLSFHHANNLFAPPPPQLRPQTPPPPPQQFHPQNLQFSYNSNSISPNNHTIHDSYHHQQHLQRSQHDPSPFSQLPRVSHQFDDDRKLPRLLPEFDHHVHDSRPDFRVSNDDWQIKHGFEGNSVSRFIEGRNIVVDRESDNYHRRSQFVSNSDRSSGDFRMLSSQSNSISRGFEPNLGTYENWRGSGYAYHDGGRENQRWVNDRDARDVTSDARDSFIQIESNENVAGETRFVTGKREHYRSREGNFELERHGVKRSREGSYEFNRTPRKLVQKKSALLRIQKPTFRNREDERKHYFEDTKSSFYRGKDQESGFVRGKDKDQELFTDRAMGEELREGSPVELDVSFKSNSLVAKAIVTPFSSSVGAPETKLTPRNSKVRKVLVPDKVNNKSDSVSSMNKLNKLAAGLDNSSCCETKASSSNKDLKKSKEGVTAAFISTVRDSGSLPGKSKVETPTKNSVLVESRTDIVSGRTSSVKGGKKKKVVKKTMKKGADPNSSLSTSQPTKTCHEPVKGDSFAHNVTSPIDPDKAAAVTDIVDSQSCANEGDRVEGLTKVRESGLVGAGADSAKLCGPNINGRRSHFMAPSGSSTHEETKFDESLVKGHCPHTDRRLATSLDETLRSDIGGVEDVSKQLCQNGDSSLLEHNTMRGSPNVLHPIEDNADFGLLSPEKMILYEGPANSCIATTGLEIALTRSQDRITVSDMGSSDAGWKELCTNQAPAKNGILDEFPNASVPVASGSQDRITVSDIGSSDAGCKELCTNQAPAKNGILDEFPNASVPVASGEKFLDNQGVGAILDSLSVNSEETNFSGHVTGDDISKLPSQDGITKPFENVSVGGSLNTMVSTSGSGEDLRDLSENDKKIAMTQTVSSSSNVFDMHLEPANAITSTTAHWVDTTLRLCFEDTNTAESTVSGSGFLDAGSQPCSDLVGALSWGSLTNLLEGKASVGGSIDAGPTGASTLNERKRKSSASQLELHGPLECVVEEGPVVAGISTSGVETATDSRNALAKPEEEVLGSDTDPLCTSALLPARKALPETCSEGEHFSIVASVKDAFEDDGMKSVHSYPAIEEVAVLKMPSPCAVDLGDKHITYATRIIVESSKQKDDSIDNEIGKGEKMDVDSAEEQVDISIGTIRCQIPSKLHSWDLDEKMPCTDVENDSCHGAKNDLPSMSKDLSSFGDDNGVSTTNSSDEIMDFVPDTLSDMCTPELLPDVMGRSLGQNSVEKIHGKDNKIPVKNLAKEAGSTSSTCTSPSQSAEIVSRSDRAIEVDHSLTGKTGPLLLQDSKITTNTQTTMSGKKYGKKNQTSHAVSKIYPSRSSFVFTTSKITASSTHVSKTRTWHRDDNSSSSALAANKAFPNVVAAQRQFLKKIDMFQGTSYIRKGNSLVRKPTAVAAQSQVSHGLSSFVYQLNRSGTNESKKSAGSDCGTDVTDPANVGRTVGADASFERPSTPPLSTVPKILNCTTNPSGDHVSSHLSERLHGQSAEIASALEKSMESNDVPKTSDDALKLSESSAIQNGKINNLEFQHDLNIGKLVSANVKSIAGVERKLNQLVATSNPCASAVHNASNMSFSSDGYYKRRKNQLIRTSMENEVKRTVSLPDESLHSDGQTTLNSTSSRSFSKRRLCKVVTKTCKPSKLSLVWTLHGAHLSKNDDSSSHYQKVLPHLFPWKRTTFWSNILPNSSSSSDYSSLSTIGKLLLLRKRDTVYTRSKHGFSLRKSKVLSVAGSSLKWSKSIERHSKKANEQATLAVAAAEREKRDQQDAAHAAAGTKSRNGSSRERIFRIGSVRYQMDSSRGTLQRISDDESSCSAVLKKEKDAKKSYVPRRLVIGKDEYVRIGNGNQLIRDPKKRTRILASEKVRWSLHTARSRLARRRKYCQFFTRFGKCNKDGGKCPFIHDSSKIAVCTKFLNGLCSNPDCKLTHKVIPERMPDCSYFLQGLCTNKNCPYRHVRVNPNASTCEGFLRGYCANGNECRKKHSYVCPIYEATGSCPQGSDCKLHHPKNRSKEKKSKQSREKKNVLGRYFGLLQINVNGPRSSLPEKRSVLDSDVICFEGSITDYISLDVSDDEVGETNNPANKMFSGGDPVDLQLGDLDELIKPVRIMDKRRQNDLPSLAAQV